MEHGARLYLFVLLLPVAHGALRSGMDHLWVKQPRDVIEILVGDNMTLGYSYEIPQSATGKYQVELSHYIPNNNYEDVLISVFIDTESLKVEKIHEQVPGKVHIIPQGHGFTFIVTDIKLHEWGRYLTDVIFSTGNELQDTTQVTVYSRPSFRSVPIPTNVILRENDTAMFEWILTELPALPEINFITIRHTIGSSNYTLVNQSKIPETGQWVVAYPEEEQRFADRISYSSSPKLTHIGLHLWGLQPGDSGEYAIEIVCVNHVTKLEHTTKVQVTHGYDWKVAPSSKTHVIFGEENVIEFEADTATRHIQQPKYEFSRLGDRDPNEDIILGYVMIEGNSVTKHKAKDCKRSWMMDYDVTRGVLMITIRKAESEDSGHYLMRLMSGANTIMTHIFEIITQNETALRPIPVITANDKNGMSCLSLYANPILPSPDISLYIEGGQFFDVVQQAGKESSFAICLSQSALTETNFQAVLSYDSRAVAHRTQIVTNINRLFKDSSPLTRTEYADTLPVRGITVGPFATEHDAQNTNDCHWYQVVIVCACVITLLVVVVVGVITIVMRNKMMLNINRREKYQQDDETESLKFVESGDKTVPRKSTPSSFLKGVTSNKRGH